MNEDKDIFNEFEKSINDAFEPNKKKKKSYMFNETYDFILRQKWENDRIRRESNSYVDRVQIMCKKCRSNIEVSVIIKTLTTT